MNRTGAIVTTILAGCGYYVGWIHGHGVGEREAEVVQFIDDVPFPYEAVCADMLESAWSIPPADGSPHKP